MFVIGVVKREEEVEEVYEFSLSSINSDDFREVKELGKRSSFIESFWGEGFFL